MYFLTPFGASRSIEYTLALFDSGAILNFISHKMAKKLHFGMQYTNRSIKVANLAS